MKFVSIKELRSNTAQLRRDLEAERELVVTVNGRPFTVEPAEEGRVLVDGISYQVALEEDQVRVTDESYSMQVTGLSLGRADAVAVPEVASAAVKAGPGAVVAIMPGKITRIMVTEGQEVHVGDAVCVLEAMKMENELNAPTSGIVKQIFVSPGANVEQGQLIADVE